MVLDVIKTNKVVKTVLIKLYFVFAGWSKHKKTAYGPL